MRLSDALCCEGGDAAWDIPALVTLSSRSVEQRTAAVLSRRRRRKGLVERGVKEAFVSDQHRKVT